MLINLYDLTRDLLPIFYDIVPGQKDLISEQIYI